MVARPPASRPGSIGRASPCLVCLDSVGVRLKLGVHGAEQSPDGRTHSLVAHVNDHRDCGEDQRVFRHRLTPRVLVSPHIQLSDQVSLPCPPSVYSVKRTNRENKYVYAPFNTLLIVDKLLIMFQALDGPVGPRP